MKSYYFGAKLMVHINQFNLIGLSNDYYVALGITFSGMYEFPIKKFYWALSTDFKFTEMPDLND